MIIQRTLYLVAWASWVAFVILHPTWMGRLYNQT
jgi:hypothetical protein